jgi:hypothetical protein
MMEIKMNKMEYQFDGEGNTTGIAAGYTGYNAGDSLNATAVITEGALDDLSKKEIDLAGRTKAVLAFGTDAVLAAAATLQPVEPEVLETSESESVVDPASESETAAE